jgi:taurine--2-oxoglutarate transaminase
MYRVMLILDEVMCGFGRIGSWFAFEHYEVVPDLITFAKGVNSGYVSVGGVLVNEAVCKTYADEMFWGVLTYSGHPLACASIVADIQAMRSEGILHSATAIGAEVLLPALPCLLDRHEAVGDVRGYRLFLGCGVGEGSQGKDARI